MEAGVARVTTKTGDEGYTGLLGPDRVPKYHLRPEAYGTVDEATSLLGVVRARTPAPQLRDPIYAIQRDLYTLMAELATPLDQYDRVEWKIGDEHVARLESLSNDFKTEVEIGKEFIIPGATETGALLDVARTVVRRAERQVARLYHLGEVRNARALQYLNRLSDLLFIMARWQEQHDAP